MENNQFFYPYFMDKKIKTRQIVAIKLNICYNRNKKRGNYNEI
ncbi:hypothetical protein HMPREF0202_00093 [Cetobacterium somerae ATCC BAA-474]|uniref:Uncharacterized protein n=1 Tax=Cetobacterium somerae ATCC BAA-474 TaxID=1319815 RepID=U7VER4_9FUSO|nr:hypothetical protein HMPREF0202_00093 [Cetobacterium somerae ATCC BAA-474]